MIWMHLIPLNYTLKIVKMVNFMLHVFPCNFFKSENEENSAHVKDKANIWFWNFIFKSKAKVGYMWKISIWDKMTWIQRANICSVTAICQW